MSAAIVLHPAFCDPRRCLVADDGDTRHEAAPTTIVASDQTVSVALFRFDEPGDQPLASDTRIHVTITDGRSCMPGSSEPILIDGEWTSADARMVAAALLVAADQLAEVTR